MLDRLKKIFSQVLRKWRQYVLIFLMAGNGLVWYMVGQEDSGGMLTVVFLDVGQGAAVYIRTASGHKILVDTGQDPTIIRELGKVMPFYDRTLDGLVITSDDADRIGGALSVLYSYNIKEIIDSGQIASDMTPSTSSASTASVSQTLAIEIKHKMIKEVKVVSGTRLYFPASDGLSDETIVDFLFPDRDLSGLKLGDSDYDSTVMKVSYGNTSVILMGNAPESVQKYLAELYEGQSSLVHRALSNDAGGIDHIYDQGSNNGLSLKSDILEIPHEGAASSTALSFAKNVSPSFAVIGVGADNRYGYPRASTIDMLSDIGATVLITAGKGAIIFRSDGKKWTENRL